jgi:hypothetical protein
VERLLWSGLRAWKSIGGGDSVVGRLLGKQYRVIKSKIKRKWNGDNFIIFWSNVQRERRVGIYVRGSCDLVSILFCQPLIHRLLTGTCCIIRDGLVSDSRSDVLLQGLQDFPQEWLDPVIARLKLPTDYFQPRFFEKSFAVRGSHGHEEFPKTVIFISIAADVTRTVYRHRQHGFLVDPGEWWLKQSVANVLGDLSHVTWFWENFVSIGKLSVDAFAANLNKIIMILKQQTEAHILVFNTLTTDSDSPSHTERAGADSLKARRRAFNAKLEELSRHLDFSIVDVDLILKRTGLGMKGDAVNFPPEREEPSVHDAFRVIAREAFRMMRELGVFGS